MVGHIHSLVKVNWDKKSLYIGGVQSYCRGESNARACKINIFSYTVLSYHSCRYTPWFLTSEETMKQEGQVDRYLGLQIRRKREQTGETLTGAAEAIGISPSLLSQIERGIVNPSISTLRAIADYLETSVGVLLGERATRENVLLVRKNDRRKPIVAEKGAKFSILSPSNYNLQFVYYEFEPDSSTGDKPYQHEGEESVFVLKGKLEITVSDRKFTLKEGDFMWFHSPLPHRTRNLAKEKSIAIWVGTPPF